VGSGQLTEIKAKNVGKLKLDIESDLSEFDEKNPS
jgi:hypothetical protein